MLSGQFIQPSGSPATEVMTFSLPQYCLPWLSAVAHYLKQNLLIFLHVPKYTDMNTAHHFKVQANISPHVFSLIFVFKSLINTWSQDGVGHVNEQKEITFVYKEMMKHVCVRPQFEPPDSKGFLA